jgi:hypothetical protein
MPATAQTTDPEPVLDPAVSPQDLPPPDPVTGTEYIAWVHLNENKFQHTPQTGDEKIRVRFDLSSMGLTDAARETLRRRGIDDPNLVAALDEVQIGQNRYAWSGNIEGFTFSEASVSQGDSPTAILTVNNQVTIIRKTDYVASNGRAIYLVASEQVQDAVDEIVIDKDGDGDGPKARSSSDPEYLKELQNCAADPETKEIVVGVFYTTAAKEAVGESRLRSEIEARFAQFPTLISRSNHPDQPLNVRFIMAGSGAEELQISEADSVYNIFTKWWQLDHVKQRRTDLKADIISLVLSRRDEPNCGWGYIPGDLYKTWNKAANVVPLWCVTNNKSLLHEIGHNAGLGHFSINNCPGQGIYDYSCGWKADGFSTLMTYSTRSQPRVLNLSNPKVVLNGHPTGSASHNNALTAQQTRCTASNWK